MRIGARPERLAIKSIERRKSCRRHPRRALPSTRRVEGYEGHFEHFDGGWTVGFEAYSQDADLAPFFKGLPNDECQCEHMGYVIRGKVGFRSGAGEELFEAGDAYYVGPGHTPILYAGTEVVEFSPTKELGETMEVVTKNMEQMEASA